MGEIGRFGQVWYTSGMAETKKSTAKKSSSSAPKATKAAKTSPPKKTAGKKTDSSHTIIADNTTFELTIAASTVEEGRQKALTQARNRLKQDGFRKGHAPDKMVEKTVGQQFLLQHTLEAIVPPAYEAALKEKKLQPLTEPDIKPLSMEVGQDWVFEVAVAQRPSVDASKYEEIVKKAKTKSELWPEKQTEKSKDESVETSKEDLRQQRLQTLLTALLENIEVQVPELLLRRETEYQLHELEHQLEHMKMSFEDFLKNSGKTREDVQQDYAARALGNLQVELLLGAIITQAKLENSEEEVSQVRQLFPE